MTTPTIIDADGHVNAVPVMERYCELIDEPQRSRVRPAPDNPLKMLIDGQVWPREQRQTAPSTLLVRGETPMAGYHEQEICSGMWDPHKRIGDMDVDGIAVAALFPGRIGMGAPGHPDIALGTAMTRAYNTWMAEYCSPYPDRLKGVAVVPAQDIEASVAEVRRCVEELGFVGASVQNWVPALGRNLDDPFFDPLWAEAERLDIPICVHHNLVNYSVLEERFTTYLQKKPVHDSTENMLAVQSLIYGGVMDRFPKLRFAFMEGGIGWVPFWMDRISEYHEEFLAGTLARGTPADYFRSEQCFFSCEAEEQTIGYVAQVIGADRVLYASDYLHHDATFPGSTRPIEERTDLSDEDKVKILGGNAAVLYRLG